MTLLLDCLEHHPASAADSAIVWMHGLGASYSDFLSVIPHLGLPRTRLVFPQAPSQPVTINAGYVMPSWYDIRTMHASPERESAEDIRASRETIHALVEREIARGIDPGRIVLAGFSQGGAMSLFVAHRFPRTLAGIVVLSAYPLMPEAWGEGHAANAETPVFFGHGRHDDVVDVGRGREGAALVGARGVWHDYAMGHELCMQEVRDLAGWLGERLR